MQIYWGSVGGNSSLLLNIPPDKNGLLAKADVRRLRQFGDELRKEFPENLAKDCIVTASSQLSDDHIANNVIGGKIIHHRNSRVTMVRFF